LDDLILILLVEDEHLIRLNLEEDLADAGFDVVLATNGDEAIAELDLDAARFRAVLTDIRLGAGADGWGVARHARESVSGMPIVYISGDSGHDWPVHGVPDSVMVPKPFVAAQILTALSTLLNRPNLPT
jgi:DNA-binding response OmpR family regulator